MEKTIDEIRERAAVLNAYVGLLEEMARREKWYQHRKTIISAETGEEVETDEWIDDDGEYSASNLKAVRSVANAIRKLAGI